MKRRRDNGLCLKREKILTSLTYFYSLERLYICCVTISLAKGLGALPFLLEAPKYNFAQIGEFSDKRILLRPIFASQKRSLLFLKKSFP